MSEAVYISVRGLRAVQGEPGELEVTLEGGERQARVIPRPCFPLSDPGRCICLLDARDRRRPIGILEDPAALDAESRRALRAALERQACIHEIRRIFSMEEKRDTGVFHVLSDHGETRFTVRGIRENVSEIAGGGIVITDAEGVRYRIGNTSDLDGASRRILGAVV